MLAWMWRAGVGTALLSALVVSGCGGDDDARVDAGAGPVDAATRDAGGGGTDAATTTDGGGGGTDAAATTDGGGGGGDAGNLDAGRTDGGGPGVDAGPAGDAGAATDAGPRPDGAVVAVICGGLAGGTCAASAFCDYPDGSMCGADDSTGVCTPRPMVCTRIFDPACGCDGMDYSNPCTAQAAGTDVAYMGMCTTSTGDCRTMGCAAGETCNICRGPGGGVWICLPAGTVC